MPAKFMVGTSQSSSPPVSSFSVCEKETDPVIENPSEPKKTAIEVLDVDVSLLSGIYEIGLRYASPKVIMSLMPQVDGLHTEHVKSHLQKCRIRGRRSKIEFQQYCKDDLIEYVSADDTVFQSNGRKLSKHTSKLKKRGLTEEEFVNNCISIVNQMDGEIRMTGQLIQEGVQQFDDSHSLKCARVCETDHI